MRAEIPHTRLSLVEAARGIRIAEIASTNANPVAPPRDYVEPVILPTEEGVHLARERTRGLSSAAMILVYTVAVLAIGFVAGQVVTQLTHDARAYELSRRV